MTAARWFGVIEGYYGPPFTAADRLELIAWAAECGLTDYVYAPKGDPLLRDRWREPYDALDEIRALVTAGDTAGVRVSVVVSPGLDWRGGDDMEALVAKLRGFYDAGATALGVAWDDVPRGGADLGAAHGRATAGAVAALPEGIAWATCPTDYAISRPTAYFTAFAAELIA